MTYVIYLQDTKLKEVMQFARNLRTNTKGETMFDKVRRHFIKNDNPFENILAYATDGTVGKCRDFLHI